MPVQWRHGKDTKPEAQKDIDEKVGTTPVSDPRSDATAWHIGTAHRINFRRGYDPYNHDYHHIMPMEALLTLGDRILEQLMVAGYSLNDGINMIILPQDRGIGVHLGLPRHLIRTEKKADGKVSRAECFSHGSYDDYVLKRLRPIIDSMFANVESGECPDPVSVAADRESLEKLSCELYDEVRSI